MLKFGRDSLSNLVVSKVTPASTKNSLAEGSKFSRLDEKGGGIGGEYDEGVLIGVVDGVGRISLNEDVIVGGVVNTGIDAGAVATVAAVAVLSKDGGRLSLLLLL